MISWSGTGGGGLDGIFPALLDDEAPSRFSIRPASASEFIENQAPILAVRSAEARIKYP
jgi:hypothetical protein